MKALTDRKYKSSVNSHSNLISSYKVLETNPIRIVYYPYQDSS